MNIYKMHYIIGLLFLIEFTHLLAQKPELKIPKGNANITSFDISSDEKYLLTSSYNVNYLTLWEIKTGKELKTFNGHKANIIYLCFSKSGKYAISCGDFTAIIWNIATGEKLLQLKGKKEFDMFYSAKFSYDEKTVFTVGDDGFVNQWDINNGNLLKSCKLNVDKNWLVYSQIKKNDIWIRYMSDVKFYPNSNFVTYLSTEGVHFFDYTTGKKIKTINFPKTFNDYRDCSDYNFSPDGKFMYSTKKIQNVDYSTESMLDQKQFNSFIVLKTDITNETLSEIYTSNSGFLYSNSNYFLASYTNSFSLINFNETSKKHQINCYSNHITNFDISNTDNKIIAIVDSEAFLCNFSSDIYIKKIQTSNDINSACFSSSGKYILTANVNKTAKLFDEEGKFLNELIGHKNEVTKIDISKDEKFILTGSKDSSIFLWDFSGNVIHRYKDIKTDKFYSLEFAPNDSSFLIGSKYCLSDINVYSNNKIDYINKLPKKKKKISSNFLFSDNRKFNGKYTPDGKNLIVSKGWNDNFIYVWDIATKEVVKKLKASTGSSMSICISHDSKFLFATEEKFASGIYIKMWDINTGDSIRTFIGHKEEINDIKVTSDNKYLVSCSNDNSIKFWDIQNGKELLSIILVDTSDWVITTPEGLFDASPGAMKKMYYVVGLEPIELEQLKERYYEPGLLGKVMGLNSEPLRNVKGFGEVKMSPAINLSLTGEVLNVSLEDRGGGIGKYMIFINGKESLVGNFSETDIKFRGGTTLKSTFNLQNHPYLLQGVENEIEVRAYNGENYILSRGEKIYYKTEGTMSTDQPRLFILSVGVSDYTGVQLDLKYAAKDAEDMANALEIGAKRLFGTDNTKTYHLTTIQNESNLQPTKTNITKTFDIITQTAKPTDIIAVYLSGHGINWGGQDGDFYYLTKDAYTASSEAYNDSEIRNSCSISSAELTELLKKVPALKQVLIIDACSSGKMVDNLITKRDISSSTIRALDRMKDRTGMHIITGCTADAVSYEASKFGQGLLTYSILEGIKGTALREGKFVDVIQLFQKARDRVPELAIGIGGIQKPVTFSPFGAESFDIGELSDKDKASIPLAKEKPMFLLSSFQNAESFADDLGLEKLVDEAFRNYSIKGMAKLIFVEAKEYPEAYCLRGQYNIENENINLKVNLFKGKEKISTFSLADKKNSIEIIVDKIIKKAEETSQN